MANSTNLRPSVFDRLARAAFHHKWAVMGTWAIGLAALVALAAAASGQYATRFTIPGSESQKAVDLLTTRFPAQSGSTSQIVFYTDAASPPLTDPALSARITEVVAEARQLPDVTGVSSPFEADGAVSKDGHTAFATVQYSLQADDLPATSAEALVSFVDRSGGGGLTVEAGGQVVEKTEQGGLGPSEMVGVAAAAVILVVAFGSVVAMGLPILTALVSLGGSIALLGVGTRFLDMTEFTPSFAAMIGLGVGIDYALLVITRFREGLHGGLSVEDSVANAVGTAGRSVLFAGSIVIIAMLGLTLIGIPFIGALGIAAAIVVALSIVAALTLLPAALALLGNRVDALGVPLLRTQETNHEKSIWYRLSRAIQRRPVVFALGASAILVALAVPFFSMDTGLTDAGNNAPSTHSRRAYDLLSSGFGKGFNAPLAVVVDTSGGGDDKVAALASALTSTPNVEPNVSIQSNQAGDTTVITIYPGTAPQAAETASLVHRLRNEVIPKATAGTGMRAYVAGATASNIDVTDRISSRTPIFFAMVIGLSFLVLMAVFRSLIIPLKAAVMNLLSIGAAYGVVVAVFQWGWFAGPLRIGETGPIESFLPMMLFAILFGLSMDYEVFLVSRIREEHLAGMNNSDAVAMGLASTARVITSAALIMIAVFGSFALGDERVIKEFGLGLATAVFLDATVVRLLLVPAFMELMGETNWWLPRKLGRLLPRVNIEGPALARPAEPKAE